MTNCQPLQQYSTSMEIGRKWTQYCIQHFLSNSKLNLEFLYGMNKFEKIWQMNQISTSHKWDNAGHSSARCSAFELTCWYISSEHGLYMFHSLLSPNA